MLTTMPTCVILTDDMYAREKAQAYYRNSANFNRTHCSKAQQQSLHSLSEPGFCVLGKTDEQGVFERVKLSCETIPQLSLGTVERYRRLQADLFIIAVNPAQSSSTLRAAHLIGIEGMCRA